MMAMRDTSARDSYLHAAAARLRLPDGVRDEVIEELATHLADATDEGVAHLEASLPAVVSVNEKINEPRYPSFKGIMAAKKTAELIPLCHPLALSAVTVELACQAEPPAVEITATCRVRGPTGVEMEALCAVSAAALTVYDMCKAVDRGMCITDIRLRHKAGGRSGSFTAD